jgi:asparagine synthase (glutamine-hydrolysing)
MCGIAGFISLNQPIDHNRSHIERALKTLHKRGPDAHGIYRKSKVELGHTRLSIIDTSSDANQPMTDESGRYTLVFNGEIYNFKELKENLKKRGVNFKTESDTEVLLYGFIHEGKSFLQKLNGFFACCFYDSIKDTSILARDRFGIKPFYYYHNSNKFIFGSELKAILSYPIEKAIDSNALNQYFRFNYIPAPQTIFQSCKKLLPGHCIIIEQNKLKIESYFSYYPTEINTDSYEDAKQKVSELIYKSVEKRMISDVPLGTFLSGGVDSSIISAVASKINPNLNTFSIGFPDEPLFDESKHAENVAKHLNTNHHTFQVTNSTLFQNLDEILNYMDEPFADSSAINVYLLSKETRKNVTVSLSGDGADELFSGYNKHQALHLSLQNNLANNLVKKFGGLASLLPDSRNSKLGNFGRKLNKLHNGLKLPNSERYLEWASFMDKEDIFKLTNLSYNNYTFNNLAKGEDKFNDFLSQDFNLVLVNDMLKKVDLMSMANSLEIRTPFLDHELVNYVFSLPSNYKIDKNNRKKILKDAFSKELPNEVFNRNKHGFEVPLKKWYKNELKTFLDNHIFTNNILVKEGILKQEGIQNIHHNFTSSSSGNNVYHIWALIVLEKYFRENIL